MMCLLHHLQNPEKVLEDLKKLKSNIFIFLPTDPSLTWRIGRSIAAFLNKKYTGISVKTYKEITTYHHRNSYPYLRGLLNQYFGSRLKNVSYSRYIKFWNLKMYDIYHISNNDSDVLN